MTTSINKLEIYNRLLDCFKDGDLDKFKGCLEDAQEGFNPVETICNYDTGKQHNIMAVILEQIFSESHFKTDLNPFLFFDTALSYSKGIDTYTIMLTKKNLMGYVITFDGSPQKKCECIKMLAKHGVDINFPAAPCYCDNILAVPLLITYQPEVLETLISLGATLSEDIVSNYILMQYPSPFNDEYKRSPEAAFENRLKCLELLLQHIRVPRNAVSTVCLMENSSHEFIVYDRDAPYARKYTELTNDYALKVLDMVLEAGADIKDSSKITEQCSSLPLFKKLTELGYDVNARDLFGRTILYRIIENPAAFLPWEILDFVEGFCQCGGDPDLGAPIFPAAARGETEIIKIMAAHGADLDIRGDSSSGCTPALWILSFCSKAEEACKRTLEVLKVFDDLGADLSYVNDYGDTPLYIWASSIKKVLASSSNFNNYYMEILDILLKYNDINEKDADGRIAASTLAVLAGHKYSAKVIPYLMEMAKRGADLTLTDNDGLTVLDHIPYKKYRKQLEQYIERINISRETEYSDITEFAR